MAIVEPASVIEETWIYDVCLTCEWEGESVPSYDPTELEAQDAYYHDCNNKNLVRRSFIMYYAACYICSWEIPDASLSEEEIRPLVNRHNLTCVK